MENKLKVVEVFRGIQGEGKYAGTPMLFIRLSGCTRKCSFCDTKYHVDGKKTNIRSLAKRIVASGMRTICFTGGEPLMQRDGLHQLMAIIRTRDRFYEFHLETNGDLLKLLDFDIFDYIAISPKGLNTAKAVNLLRITGKELKSDIKVVTDMDKTNVKLIEYASILMPLTTYNNLKDTVIRRKVWEECIKSGIHYSPRLHYDLFGRKRGV